MTNIDIVRAWTDPEYRRSLSASQQEMLPAHPAGLSPIDSELLNSAVGGSTEHMLTLGCCGGFTDDAGFCSLVCGTDSDICERTRNTNCTTELCCM